MLVSSIGGALPSAPLALPITVTSLQSVAFRQ